MADPSNQDLREAEPQHAEHRIGTSKTYDPGSSHEQKQQDLNRPQRFIVYFNLLVKLHIFLRRFARLLSSYNFETLQHFFGLVGVKCSASSN